MRYLCWVFALFLCARCHTPQASKATFILVNGHFFTADPAKPEATAVAIANGRILAVGTDAEIKALAAPDAETLDLKGAFAMPGLIEGHGHFLGLGRSLQNLNLLETTSWEAVVDAVAERAKTTAPGEWIEGRGWHQEKWPNPPAHTVNGYPYHDLLSAAAPNNPVLLDHASGHGVIANAKAMELAGINKETPDPIGGRIVRDAAGNLTGVFEENAAALVERPFNAWKNKRSEAEKQAAFDAAIALATQTCLAKGITSFQDAGSHFWELAQYKRLAESQKLGLRLWAMIAQPKPSELSRLADYPQIGLGNGFFTVRAVKCYMDGALGSYGAWLLAPYADKPGFIGQNVTPLDTVAAVAAACQQHGLQCCVHAIGDRGNRETLDIFAKTLAPSGDKGQAARWRIEHAQHIDPTDIPRFKTLGVIASMQAVHCTSDAPFVVKRLGEQRAKTGAYVWRSLLDTGAHLANGTDAPVEKVDPLPSIYAAAARKRSANEPAFFPEQCMSRAEALLSYTLWNAYAAFEENEKGSLTPGKMADIAVFDRDLLRCPVDELPQAQATYTILGGKVVYRG